MRIWRYYQRPGAVALCAARLALRMAPRNLRQLKGRVSLAAWANWHLFVLEHRVNVSAVMEAIGEALGSGAASIDLDWLAERAAQIQDERNARE